MREREPTVHHQTTLRPRNQTVRPPAGLVKMHQRRRIGDEQRLETELLEDDLVGVVLDGGEVEEGFGEEEGGEVRGDVEEGEEVGPDGGLEVRVD